MVNKVILVGNLGADPETRTTTNGTTVATLRVATTTSVKDQNGNWEDRTEWHRVVCFGRTAENAERFLKKGRQVYVEGRIQTNKWTDKDGIDRWTTEVLAREIKFLGQRGDASAAEPRGNTPRPQRRNPRSGGGYGGDGYQPKPSAHPDETDIPF